MKYILSFLLFCSTLFAQDPSRYVWYTEWMDSIAAMQSRILPLSLSSPSVDQQLKFNGSYWVNFTPSTSPAIGNADSLSGIPGGEYMLRADMPDSLLDIRNKNTTQDTRLTNTETNTSTNTVNISDNTSDIVLRLLASLFGDSLRIYEGYGVTITDDIDIDTSEIATQYDLTLLGDVSKSDSGLIFETPYRVDTLTTNIYGYVYTNIINIASNTSTNVTQTSNISANTANKLDKTALADSMSNYGITYTTIDIATQRIMWSGQTVIGGADNWVYKSPSDGIWRQANSGDISKCESTLGISLSSTSVLLKGLWDSGADSTLTPNAIYWGGTSDGYVQDSAPNDTLAYNVQVGQAGINGRYLYFNPTKWEIKLGD